MILDPLVQRSEFVNGAGMLHEVVSIFSEPRTKTFADICNNREVSNAIFRSQRVRTHLSKAVNRTVERHHLPRMKAHLKKEGTEKVLREEEESADELKHPWANSNCSLPAHRLTDRSRLMVTRGSSPVKCNH